LRVEPLADDAFELQLNGVPIQTAFGVERTDQQHRGK
jgi:hypothetical protein